MTTPGTFCSTSSMGNGSSTNVSSPTPFTNGNTTKSSDTQITSSLARNSSISPGDTLVPIIVRSESMSLRMDLFPKIYV